MNKPQSLEPQISSSAEFLVCCTVALLSC